MEYGLACRSIHTPSMGSMVGRGSVYVCAFPCLDVLLGLCRALVHPVFSHFVVCTLGSITAPTLAWGMARCICVSRSIFFEPLLWTLFIDLCGDLVWGIDMATPPRWCVVSTTAHPHGGNGGARSDADSAVCVVVDCTRQTSP